jgi:hypothetical protein
LSTGEKVQPDLSIKGQRWYRGTRELLVQHNFSGIKEFDSCYDTTHDYKSRGMRRSFSDIEQYINHGPSNISSDGKIWLQDSDGINHFRKFSEYFQKARALALSLIDEVMSREIPVVSQLSFEVAATEFETAESIFRQAGTDETLLRTSGVIARVAMERHLFTVADTNAVAIILPANKKKAEASDVMISLEKARVITAIQRSELESLFKIGNNCAHPKDPVIITDIERLVTRAKEVVSVIL